jgi:hypothetical protein
MPSDASEPLLAKFPGPVRKFPRGSKTKPVGDLRMRKWLASLCVPAIAVTAWRRFPELPLL